MAAAAAAAADGAAKHFNCFGISWGCDFGVVSTASVSAPASAAAPDAFPSSSAPAIVVKEPAVLANADGDRATTLWLNVANDEFLFGEGARAATNRFPQNGVHAVIKLLDRDSAAAFVKSNTGGAAAPAVCGCGRACRAPFGLGKRQADSAAPTTPLAAIAVDACVLLPRDDDDEEDAASAGKMKGALRALITLDDFIKEQHRLGNGKQFLDGEGAVVNASEKNPEEEGATVACLPQTTWECAFQVLRMIRTVVRDSIIATAGGGGSEESSKPHFVVLAVPRHHVERNVVAALARTAWRDWCKASSGGSATIVNVVPKDVAALAAVMPPQLLFPSTAAAAAADASNNTNKSVLSLVVVWGANTLTISLFAHFQNSSNSGNKNASADGTATATPAAATTTLLASRSLDCDIGGSFLDGLLAKELYNLLNMKQKGKLPRTLPESSRSFRKFLDAAERTKIVLSKANTTSVEIESAYESFDFSESGFTRSRLEAVILNPTTGAVQAKFAQLLKDVVEDATTRDRRKRAVLEAALNSSSSSSSGVAEYAVILAGGTMRIPSLSTFAKTACTTALTQLIVSSSGGAAEQKDVQAAAGWVPNKAAGGDARELVSVGACLIAQASAAATATTHPLLVQLGAASTQGVPAFTKEVTVVKKTKLDDIDLDDGDDDNGGADDDKNNSEEETIVRTAKNDVPAPQAAVLASSVLIGKSVVIPAGTLLPAKRVVTFSPNASNGFTLSVEKRQMSTAKAAGGAKPAALLLLRFPVALPEGSSASSVEIAVSAGGELTVSAGADEVMRVEL